MHAYRSHTCVDLTKDNVGDTVRLSGWVHRVRDQKRCVLNGVSALTAPLRRVTLSW